MSDRYEYIVKKGGSTACLGHKLPFLFGYVLLAFALVVIVINLFYGDLLLIPATVMAIGIEILVIFFSWRFSNVEFESTIEGSSLVVCTIKGGIHRKLSFEADISSFSEIGLFTTGASESIENRHIDKDYVFISSLKSENIYYGIFTEGEEVCIIYFETLPDGFSYIKKINRSAVRRAEIACQGTRITDKSSN